MRGSDFYTRHKQLIDQSAHFTIGALAVWCFIVGLGIDSRIAVLILVLAAGAREMLQHRDLDFGWGSAIDMLFWSLGAVAGQVLGLLTLRGLV